MKNSIQERERTSSERIERFPEETTISRNINNKKRIKKKTRAAAFLLCLLAIFICIGVIAYIVSDMLCKETLTGENKATEEEQTPYSAFPFYKEDYQKRYEDYASIFPELSHEEIVWMVNSNQDKEKYNYDIPVSGYDDITIIVNKYYKVSDDYEPSDLVLVDGQKMRQEAATAFLKMQSDAKSEGLRILAVSGYRTVSYQRGLYNRYLSTDTPENVDRYSARAGYSEHHTGLAVDVFGSRDGLRQFENTPEYPWVKENCYKYGYIIRYLKETEHITGYEAEPWHLRYVGVEISTDMKNKGINSFEEYHAKYLQ